MPEPEPEPTVIPEEIPEDPIQRAMLLNSSRRAIINLDVLNACFKDGDTVTLEILQEMKLVSSKEKKLKILSNGTLTKALTVEADFFSAHAAENICAAGGKAIQK